MRRLLLYALIPALMVAAALSWLYRHACPRSLRRSGWCPCGNECDDEKDDE